MSKTKKLPSNSWPKSMRSNPESKKEDSDEDWIKGASKKPRNVQCYLCLDKMYPRFKELADKLCRLRAKHVTAKQVWERLSSLDPSFSSRVGPRILQNHMCLGHDPDWRK